MPDSKAFKTRNTFPKYISKEQKNIKKKKDMRNKNIFFFFSNKITNTDKEV